MQDELFLNYKTETRELCFILHTHFITLEKGLRTESGTRNYCQVQKEYFTGLTGLH